MSPGCRQRYQLSTDKAVSSPNKCFDKQLDLVEIATLKSMSLLGYLEFPMLSVNTYGYAWEPRVRDQSFDPVGYLCQFRFEVLCANTITEQGKA